MKTSTYTFITTGKAARFGKSTLLAFTVASAFALSSKASAVMLQGNPYSPTGADYKIFAAQGIDAANPLGKSGFTPQVNTDFEITPSIGVSYDQGGGSLKDYGLGLYSNANAAVASTGLNIRYNAAVSASSVTIEVADFDIKSGATSFKSQKVEPSLLLLSGNTVYAKATPSDIFPNLMPVAGSKENYNINFGGILNTLGKPNAPITGFLLYADANDNETINSDPYLLVSVGNGGVIPVPEVSTILPIVGLLTAVLSTAVLRRRKAAELGMA